MERICKDAWTEYESSLKVVEFLGGSSDANVTLMWDPQHWECYAKKTAPAYLMWDLQKELDIMLRLENHPCIIRATCPVVHFVTNGDGKEPSCYIYMEYAKHRSLQKMISEIKMPEYEIQRAARMIIQGLQVLHVIGYVHCDLKPANILLFPSLTYGEPFDLKLAYFGNSKKTNSGSASLPDFTPVGTRMYMPPESFSPDIPIDPSFDIWSLGCVVYEMFGCQATKDCSGDYYHWTLAEDISPVAKDFLRRCHDMESSQRATAAELLNHPFITQKLTLPPLPTIKQKVPDWMMIPKLPGSIW